MQDHRQAVAARQPQLLAIEKFLALAQGARRGPIGQMRTLAARFRGTPGGPGALVDAAAEAADLPPEDRYALLAEDDVLARAALLLDALDRKARAGDESLPPRSDPRLN